MSAERSTEFIIMGARLNTGNLGVNALLSATVQAMACVLPDARIYLLGGEQDGLPEIVGMPDSHVELGSLGICWGKAIWRRNHLLRLLVSAAFARLLPKGWRTKWLVRNPYLRAIVSARAVMDITGGDSFSDIYGLRRFSLGSLGKVLVLLCGAKLVLLPQTYGPFKSRIARRIAGGIIGSASAVYSRDMESLEVIKRVMNGCLRGAEAQFCPDVAFVLETRRKDSEQTKRIETLKAQGRQVIGLNISGLLYNGGYTGKNEFRLKCDYRRLVREIVSSFAGKQNHVVVLVPHVIPKAFPLENDLIACEAVWRSLSAAQREKVIVLDGRYDQSEVKHLIGLCDFFIGSRMHSCIAGLSQNVPAVGLAYSKKFIGVFGGVDAAEWVVDCCNCENIEVIERIEGLYARWEEGRSEVAKQVVEAKNAVVAMFKVICE